MERARRDQYASPQAYVVMPEHVHLLIYPECDGYEMRTILTALKRSVARNAKEKSVASVIEYLHANPLRRGLVTDPAEWEWSRARFWDGHTAVPIRMDNPFVYDLVVPTPRQHQL